MLLCKLNLIYLPYLTENDVSLLLLFCFIILIFFLSLNIGFRQHPKPVEVLLLIPVCFLSRDCDVTNQNSVPEWGIIYKNIRRYIQIILLPIWEFDTNCLVSLLMFVILLSKNNNNTKQITYETSAFENNRFMYVRKVYPWLPKEEYFKYVFHFKQYKYIIIE